MSKVRKIENGSTKLFMIIFIAVIAVILCIIVAISVGAVSSRPEDISIDAGTVIYDKYYTAVQVTSDGVVSKQTDGGIYSLNADTGEKIDLDYSTMAYKDSEYQFFGGGYKVNSDGSVEVITDQSKYVFTNTPMFFKIADRKYVIVASSIVADDGNFSTTDYAYIQLDTVGNAVILSPDANIKITKPTLLYCGDITFDIANEVLYYGDLEIDMKNVITSTNTYDAGLYKEVDDEDQPTVYELTITGGSGGTGGTGGVGGEGGEGGEGGSGGTGGAGGAGGDGAFGEEQQSVELAIFTSVVADTYNSITVAYDFEDPFGALGMVYIEVHKVSDMTFTYDDEEVTLTLSDIYDGNDDLTDAIAEYKSSFNAKYRYSITSYDDEYTFYALDEYTDYYVVMASSAEDLYGTGGYITTIKDYTKVRTQKANNSIVVDTVSSSYLKVTLNLEGIDFYNENAKFILTYGNGDQETTILSESMALLAVTNGYVFEYSSLSSEYANSQYITFSYEIDNEVICSTIMKNSFYTG